MSQVEAVKRATARARGRPKNEDAAAIEARLLDAALREFVRDGYGGTSMTQIVAAAQISKTTLYARYPSKDELFRAIMHRQIERVGLRGTLMPEATAPDLEAGLTSYGEGALRFSLQGEWLDLSRLIYSEASRFPELSRATAESSSLGIRHIADFIQRCAIADDIACQDAEAIAQIYIFALRGFSTNAMVTKSRVPRVEIEQFVSKLVRSLIAARSTW